MKGGTCYKCNCFIDDSIKVREHCDHKTLPSNCPLKNGLIVKVYMSDEGNLLIGHDHI